MLLNGPRLTHRVPFLWRFHVVHHIRAAQVVSALPVTLTARLAPPEVQEALRPYVRRDAAAQGGALVVFTPRLHVIHHSIVRTETDSN